MRVLQQPDNMESSVPTSYVEIDEELFQQLKALRAKIAKVQSVPAFVIFTDAALRDMCIKLPQNLKSFLEVKWGRADKGQSLWRAIYQVNTGLLPKNQQT